MRSQKAQTAKELDTGVGFLERPSAVGHRVHSPEVMRLEKGLHANDEVLKTFTEGMRNNSFYQFYGN